MPIPGDPRSRRQPQSGQPTTGPMPGSQGSLPPQGPGEESQKPPEPPEIPKKLRRQTTVVILIGVAVLFVIALTRFGGGSPNITATSIGPLEIGHATRTEMQHWAVGEVSFWFVGKNNPPVEFNGQLWQYKCIGAGLPGQPCRTLFGITHGHVATVLTTDPRYHTSDTHIGTPLATALSNEHGTFSGWDAKCPHVTLKAAKDTTFLILIKRTSAKPDGYVSGFYLSVTPSSFSYCQP